MATTSPFHQTLHLMPEVGGDLSHSSGVHPATPPQKKVATRKVRTYQRYWERTYLNNSWSLMKNQPATHFPELITSSDYVKPIIKKLFPHHSKNTPLAGRITNFVSNWSKLTNDKEILQTVKGLKIQFLERPNQKQPPAETKMSLEEKLVDSEVQELLRKGAITPTRVSEDQFVSNIFLRPKKDGRFRPIINSKKIEPIHSIFAFQMEGLKQLKDLLRQNDLMVEIDLKDVYFSIPLHPETEICKVSMERQSIPIPVSLFWSGTMLPGSSPNF